MPSLEQIKPVAPMWRGLPRLFEGARGACELGATKFAPIAVWISSRLLEKNPISPSKVASNTINPTDYPYSTL
jgi:hypothetical protein